MIVFASYEIQIGGLSARTIAEINWCVRNALEREFNPRMSGDLNIELLTTAGSEESS